MQSNYNTLVEKLNTFIREYYKNLIIRGCIYSILGMCAMLIIFAVVEHFSFLNGFVRSILFWSYCAATIVILLKYIVVPFIKMLKLSPSLTHEDAAKIIGIHFKEVADKLTNILELKSAGSGSEALIHASINQKIKDIQFTPFNQAVDWGATISYSKYLAIPIIVLFLFIISGNKSVISGSMFRIVNYNTHFEKPAPFYFKIKNPSLEVIKKSDFEITVEIVGDELPQNVYINYNSRSIKMSPVSKKTFNYIFNSIEDNTTFYLSANNEYSKEYEITTLNRPEIEEVVITVIPPRHTKMNSENYLNTGSISVPQGSKLIWAIRTVDTDTVKFKINQNSYTLTNTKNNFNIEKTITENSKYEITLANSNTSFIDTAFYDVKIVSDAHPIITISRSENSKTIPLIDGLIRDDYGFSKLNAFARIYGLNRDTIIKERLEINPVLRSQVFIGPFNSVNLNFNAGEIIDLFFKVSDNDAINGYKETTSETITFNAPTIEDFEEEYEEQNTLIKNDIASEMAMLKDLKKELTDFEKDLIDKDSLDWRDRKKLEDILSKQANLEQKIEALKKSSKSNFEQLNSASPPTKEILKKQQALEKLFSEIMPDEMKELYKELSDLKDQLNKNDLQEKLQELQLSNEDLEKELDRNLEILKQLEFDQKLQSLIDKLNALKESQRLLAETPEENMTKKIESQQKSIEDFKKIQQEISEMKSLNKDLENKKKISSTEKLEEEVKQELSTGKEKLENNRKKQASKSQKEASEKLEKLAGLFESMQSKDKEKQQYEDMDVLRQILENLVYFSIAEEDILLEFQELNKDDPQYVELMHKQQTLRDATKVIEDSLFALSKRVPQVSSKINREINAIDKKTGSAIDHLRERLTLKAVQDQQFIMTSANNLAVLLSNILDQMQQEMASDLPSTQQCEKPGKGSPKPGDLKKMQEQLNKHLEELKKEIEKGNKNDMQGGGMSKKLVEMLAKQELIRESLEELRDKIKDPKGLKSLENAINNMEKTENDIANKKISRESLNRQKEILTRLLEVEDALRQQGEDEKRESKTANKEYEKIIKSAYEKYEMQKLKQTELLKTQPAQMNEYYKDKVDRYFNLILQ